MRPNEITVKCLCGKNEICNTLERLGFKQTRSFALDDTYYVPSDSLIMMSKSKELLRDSIILRKFIDKSSNTSEKFLLTKKLTIDEHGHLIEGSATTLGINSTIEAATFMGAVNFSELMRIYEEDLVFENNGFIISIKAIKESDILLRVKANKNYPSLDDITTKFLSLQLPIGDNLHEEKGENEFIRLMMAKHR